MAPIMDRTFQNDVSRPDLSLVADTLVLGYDKKRIENLAFSEQGPSHPSGDALSKVYQSNVTGARSLQHDSTIELAQVTSRNNLTLPPQTSLGYTNGNFHVIEIASRKMPTVFGWQKSAINTLSRSLAALM